MCTLRGCFLADRNKRIADPTDDIGQLLIGQLKALSDEADLYMIAKIQLVADRLGSGAAHLITLAYRTVTGRCRLCSTAGCAPDLMDAT
jgi:hypothetical protein